MSLLVPVIILLVFLIILLAVILFLIFRHKPKPPPPPIENKLVFSPFGTNTYKGTYFSQSDVNPKLYEVCWLRIGTSKYLKQCIGDGSTPNLENTLIDAILDTYNCICPSLDIDINRTTGEVNAETSDKKNGGENIIFSEFTKKLMNRSIQRKKLMFVYPSITNGELLPYYNNVKMGKLNQIYKYITDRFGVYEIKDVSSLKTSFIKGFIYDTEYWDDNDDGRKPPPKGHEGHMQLFYDNIGDYLTYMCQAWKDIEPTWEIYTNSYPDSQLLLNPKFISAVDNNYNLGVQIQDYWNLPSKNDTVNTYISKVKSGKGKLVWGFAGYKYAKELWSIADYNTIRDSGFYGVFVFGGICFLINNSKYKCDTFKCPE